MLQALITLASVVCQSYSVLDFYLAFSSVVFIVDCIFPLIVEVDIYRRLYSFPGTLFWLSTFMPPGVIGAIVWLDLFSLCSISLSVYGEVKMVLINR